MAKNTKFYAKALAELGIQYGILDDLLADLEDAAEKINANLDFKRYISDPQIDFENKKKALQAVFQDFISEKTYNFLYILIKDKKFKYLDQIIEKSKEQKKIKENLAEAVVESVVPVSNDQQEQIKRLLSEKINKRILLKNLIKPELIAGLRISLKDTVIDSSVLGKLDRLKKKFAS